MNDLDIQKCIETIVRSTLPNKRKTRFLHVAEVAMERELSTAQTVGLLTTNRSKLSDREKWKGRLARDIADTILMNFCVAYAYGIVDDVGDAFDKLVDEKVGTFKH